MQAMTWDCLVHAKPDAIGLYGCLLGTAYGDALGLPYEGLSRQRAMQLLERPDRLWLIGWPLYRGLVSDDTEHAVLTLQAWMQAHGELPQFRVKLARALRWWLLLLPVGVGSATARAIVRSCVLRQAGVWSAGNGAAMRAPILGVLIHDKAVLLQWVQASTELTHRDPQAWWGSYVLALAAGWAAQARQQQRSIESKPVLTDLRHQIPHAPTLHLIDQVADSLAHGECTADFVRRTQSAWGVSGYIGHTMPAVLHAWLSQPHQPLEAISNLVACGGDADSTAALLGGIMGAYHGAAVFDPPMQACIEPILTPRYLQQLAVQATTVPVPPTRVYLWRGALVLTLLRNLLLLAVVLVHGFRRLLPPYH